MSAFDWRGKPSMLAESDKRMRANVKYQPPSPASQITYSAKVPGSINTESTKPADKVQRLRKASI